MPAVLIDRDRTGIRVRLPGGAVRRARSPEHAARIAREHLARPATRGVVAMGDIVWRGVRPA